ncbi:sigma-70 family RNA polymerase sigma factor [Streptomyces sp. NPDC056937]|uniref:sigma-70 family RNA polymerase sigma factor n=1 Tax=Streptomyces sp. NPDC056937 TaxID=3345969 RepID=UPI0036349042
MKGDGRDKPLRGGGTGGGTGGATEGGTGPEGASARQVPSQGGPKRAPELGSSGPRGARGARGGPGGAGGADGPTGAETSVPPQRERSSGSSVEQPAEPVMDHPVDQSVDQSVDHAVGQAAGQSVDQAVDHAVDQPTLELPAAGRPLSDADLIQRMRAGDDHAYEELFRRHAQSVRRYARSCCRDAHTAEDLTAEVFARTLQAVRGGAGPEQAVRAYLMTTVRRVAASWAKSAKREQLVEDFAVFAAQAARASEVSDADTLDLGADVLAMREAEQSMAMRAFRSLPERWQAVLWHTTVEEESPSEVAPLFGLSANATAVLASRAREGLKQAYLQAHVNSALISEGDCSQYADRLGAYARGGLRMRAERGLRKHLDECVKCRLVAGELAQFNAEIPAVVVLPIAVIGWFAAGYSLKAAGIVAGAAAGATGAGAAAAATGASGGAAAGASGGAAVGGASGGAAGGAAGGAGAGAGGGAVASEGLGAPAKAGIGGLVAVAAAAGLVFALANNSGPDRPPKAKPPVAQPLVPQKPVPSPGPPEPAAPKPPPPAPSPTPSVKPSEKPSPSPKPTPSRTPAPKPPPKPRPEPPAPPAPKPPPSPKPPPALADFQVNQLAFGPIGDGSKPEVRLGASGWLWQRSGVSIGGTRYSHGVTMHSASSVTIDLNRSCSRYAALVGVDDLTMGLGSVRFSLYGDGTRLWRSPVVSGGDAAVPVDVGIAGRKTIRLVVEPHTPFDVVALADWARSRISCR